MKIMLVDDSKTMRSIQKGILTQMGHTDLVEACDGQDALSKVFAEKPDLILLDWNMPNMDGLSFLQAYRQKDKATPVIMVTTEAEKHRVVDALKAGVNNYVVKPFTPDALSSKIELTMQKCGKAA
ncbi:MAG: response regulator [Phycisphaeraceae bacterium]|nr:response regulator [Phycisphaeraceae bacterium]